MVKKSRGFRSTTRKELRKKIREKFTVTKYLQKFRKGDKVCIRPEPASHRGMPHPRFIGKVGIIKGLRGNSYIVKVKDGKKTKEIISRPEHLKIVGE